jgi:hypothetical protein
VNELAGIMTLCCLVFLRSSRSLSLPPHSMTLDCYLKVPRARSNLMPTHVPESEQMLPEVGAMKGQYPPNSAQVNRIGHNRSRVGIRLGRPCCSSVVAVIARVSALWSARVCFRRKMPFLWDDGIRSDRSLLLRASAAWRA